MKHSGIEWIGDIPSDWEIKRFKYLVVDIKSGDSLTNEMLSDDDTLYPVYGGGKQIGYYEKSNVTSSNILIGRVGANCGCITKLIGKAWATDNALIVNSNDKTNYLYYLLLTTNLNNMSDANAQPLITASKVLNIKIPFCVNIQEQSAIVTFLDTRCEKIDTIIAIVETIISELNEYKNQLAVKCTTKGIRKTKLKQSNIDWVGEMPEHWKALPLFAVFNEHKCKNLNMQEDNLLSLSYGKIIRKDINTDDGLLPDNFEGYNIVEKGDIVLRLTDMQNDQRSLRTGLVRERGIITSAYVTIRNKVNANSDYLRYLLHSTDICKIIYNFGSGIRQNLTFDGLKSMPLVLPPIDEQKEITEYLDKKFKVVDNLITLKQQKIAELKEYKKSLIYEYVTGKKEPTKEVYE